MKLLDIISRVTLIGIGFALLWVFSCIIRFGSHYVQEPNAFVLAFEVVFITLIVLLAIFILIRDVLKEK